MASAAETAQIDHEHQTLRFTSGGFELFVPPTPFGEKSNFVMLDDLNDTWYRIDYGNTFLKNPINWTDLALHSVVDPAIVFPPAQNALFKSKPENLVSGFLVSIHSRDAGILRARSLGRVCVKVLPEEHMNWDALESTKQPELPVEMRNGLLRYVFNRRPASEMAAHSYVTPAGILDDMRLPWHRDGSALNFELDSRFAGGKEVPSEQVWELTPS